MLRSISCVCMHAAFLSLSLSLFYLLSYFLVTCLPGYALMQLLHVVLLLRRMHKITKTIAIHTPGPLTMQINAIHFLLFKMVLST